MSGSLPGGDAGGSRQCAGSAEPSGQLADYSMAFALLGDLASARTEDLVIERIVGMFTTICAPARSTYLQIVESVPGRVVMAPPGEASNADAGRLAGVSGAWALTPSGRGFTLRIADSAGTLGILELEDVAVPASLTHYVNLALGLVHVCGLAIRNARTYERLGQTLADLQKALAEVKTLRGILPICASCKRIRDDAGAWSQVEVYVSEHTNAEFSHGICPECIRTLYGDLMAGP